MTNLAKTSDVLLLEEINLKSGGQLAREDVVFALPAVVNENARNTKIRVNSSEGSQYSGWQDVWYNRLDIAELFTRFGQLDVKLPSDGVRNYLDVLHHLNTVYGLAIADDEVVETPIVGSGIALTIAPSSLAFYGVLNITITGQIPLDSVITTQILDGLWYPDAIVTHLINPVLVEGILAGAAVTDQGFLLVGNNNSADNFLIATNNELEVALRVGYVANGQGVNPIGNQYSLTVSATTDWNIPVSIALVDTQISDKIDVLYDVHLYIKSILTGNSVDLVMTRDAQDNYHFVNADLGIDVADAYHSANKLVVQSLQNAKAYKSQLGADIPNNGMGALLGTFEIGLVAYRRNSIVPRVAAIANVTVTAS